MRMNNGLLSLALRNGPMFKSISRRLEKSEFMSRDELTRLQNLKLKKIIKHAYRNVPYYSDLFSSLGLLPEDIAGVEDLVKIPVMDKRTLSENFSRLSSRTSLLTTTAYTSGTTGNVSRFKRDLRSVNFENATVWRLWKRAGVNPGDWIAVCRGSDFDSFNEDSPPYWRADKFERRIRFSSLRLNDEQISIYLDAAKKYSAAALQAYPSSALIIAEYLLKRSAVFPLKAVFASSEPVFPYVREKIERAFCCKVWDFYGMGERTVCADECEIHDGLHINEEYGVFELIDPETGAPSRTKGLITGTSLNNFAMPLIRYKMDDYAQIIDEPCACGRKSGKIKFVEARLTDIIRDADAQPISPLVLTSVFKELNFISKSQIIQRSLTLIEILIQPSSDKFETDERKALENGFRKLFKPGMEIKVTLVEEIPSSQSGKFRWIVSELNEEFRRA